MRAFMERRWPLLAALAFALLMLLVLLWPSHSASSMAKQPAALELTETDVATVRFTRFEDEIPFSGTLMPVQQMLLNARVGGEVIDVPVREGEAVAAGAVLVRQDARDISARLQQAEAAVLSSRAEATVAIEQANKFRQLHRYNYYAKNDLENQETRVAMLEAQLRSNEAALRMAKKAQEDALMRAPFSGVVAERMVEPGQMVAPNAPLLRLVNLRELELAAQLPSADMARIHPGQHLKFSVDAYGAEEFTARVVRINPVAKVSNRKIMVYARVDNANMRLRGGLFAKGRLLSESAPAGLALPLTAIQKEGEQSAVMVIRQNHLVWQPVTLGARDVRTANVLISSGVTEGERVLATRMEKKRAGAPVRTSVAAAAGKGST